MNTTGFIRGYLAHNLSTKKFVEKILDTMGKEFETKASLSIENGVYIIGMYSYRVVVSEEYLSDLQNRGAYLVDKFILEEFEKQRFRFDRTRSKYIRYCFGIFWEGQMTQEEYEKMIADRK